MAQPNVAREPSMEEILASIRRIIESNDPITESEAVTGAQASSYVDQDDDFDIESDYDGAGYLSQAPANDTGNAFAETVRAEHSRMTMENKIAAAAPTQEKTLSLADVAARVRAAATRVPEPMAQRAVHEPMVERAAPTAPRPVSIESYQGEQMPVDRQPQFQERAATQPATPEPVAVSVPVEAAPAAESLPARIEQATALLSDEAGAQIARSFHELTEVVNSLERETVEDMAKEMLKPMLREWLDDNLPTLVERLVREEIERVARGPRR